MTIEDLKVIIRNAKNDYVKKQDYTMGGILRSMELILDRLDVPENVDTISIGLARLEKDLKLNLSV